MVEDEPIVQYQAEIDTALTAVKTTMRLRQNGTEVFFDSKYILAKKTLIKVLYNLPQETAALTVEATIPPQPKKLDQEIDYCIRVARNLTAPLRCQYNPKGSIEVTLVVKPPYMPDALKLISFGSQARSLSEEVIETISLTEFGKVTLLCVNPLGEPASLAGRNRRATNYLIPLRYVQRIKLETERKPLTPYPTFDGQGGFSLNSVDYPQE